MVAENQVGMDLIYHNSTCDIHRMPEMRKIELITHKIIVHNSKLIKKPTNQLSKPVELTKVGYRPEQVVVGHKSDMNRFQVSWEEVTQVCPSQDWL